MTLKWMRLTPVGNRIGIFMVLAIAAFTRFFNLATPHRLVFDETYYVKDAFTLGIAGHELAWKTDPNPLFEAGKLNQFTQDPAFVVHPPLGKWLIWLGMQLLGADSSLGWRFSVALLGVASVGLLIAVANKLFGSMRWALVAGLLLAIDGLAIVMSRTAILDSMLGFFVLLAFWFLLLDRERSRLGSSWRRPWLLWMGLALGAATSVKWSGAYFAVFFLAWIVVADALTLRRLGDGSHSRWIGRSVLRALTTGILVAPIVFISYVVSWTGWLVTLGGYDRSFADTPANRWTGLFSWVPNPLQSLWRYHLEQYGFHVSLRTPHSYASSPLTWLFNLRPVAFFYEGNDFGKNGCGFAGGCSSAVTALANPLIWAAATAALGFAIYRAVKYRDSVAGLVLLGVGAGYLPWMLYLNRTVFQFYCVAFEPWLILGITYALAHYWRTRELEHRPSALKWIRLFIGLAFGLSVYFYPIWSGMTVPYWFWAAHMWLPSWI